ncbi:MAG: hypothetical protein M1833_004444 [Piccolia ochrophora]|nr:MAG: hypothetical protein M1833_004444 [Piccolia ochrophora]
MGSRLPPVPPTPADWNEDPAGATDSAALPRQRLQIDTSQVEPRFQQTEDDTAVSSTVAGSAEPGSDHPHASTMKGIRERRSESRTGKGRMIEPTSNFGNASSRPSPDQDSEVGVRPADLVLPTGNMKLARRPAVSKSTPRSARSVQSEGVPGSANSTNSPPGLESASTLESTPKLNASRDIRSPMPIAPTPPFSPGSRKQEPSPPIPPKSLPTPPLQNALQPDFRLSTTSQHASHPYHSSGHQAWPGQSFPPTPGPRTVSQDGQGTDEFVRSAIDRHRQFVEQESSATSDMERVQLFAAFIVSESRLRRENYAAAIDAMGSDVLELTRDLFRPYAKAPLTGQSPAESERSSHNGSLNSALHASSKVVESPKPRPESTWWSGYMPSLSPIPSMSVSEAPDGMSSRGRPSSRWWEASQEGSIYGAGARGFERSKRESKYMGLPLRDWDDSPGSGTTTAGPSTQTLEYPPEKVGWHEEATPQSSGHGMLDVSRLVTLPPPYPRHHPAVNNNHPNLTPIRNIVRSIADFKETTEVKERFASDCLSKKEQVHLAHKQTQNDVRRQIEVGTMSYAEAARIEASQKGQKQAVLKDQFERFEQTVMSPLKALLLERITHATAAFDSLRSHLVEQNPMEEGDEKPELLEKLTLLKWLFEAREQVHREIFTLNSSRNEHYKAMVIAPYDQEHKVREAEAFFARDATQRQVAFEKETLQRHERFMDLVEDTVKKGVEVQLSAFWDIAPSLVEVIQRVDVSQGVQTDGDYEFSQQYLWEVLCHAEQSTYQFIEGQINLLCLLHEVKSSVTKQSFKVMQMEGQAPGLDRGEQTDGLLRDEEERLTTDLKEKVTMIEKQWSEAMGTAVDEVKCDAQAWLEANGGWEGLEDV